ncbi:hypothetical protein PR048_032203 [Dryococelus australis]|uniref:Uncharacterized protein n=1 Tax=Dryococelus australis TaxID=614101 RepID=A0ABQ9G1L5_9NEOP|nr:hypothetical protein PR048_032203 [Dryococelus australis]
MVVDEATFAGCATTVWRPSHLSSSLTAQLTPRRTGFDSRGGVATVFTHVGIVPEDAVVPAGFLGDLPFPPVLNSGAVPCSLNFPRIGSQDLDIKSCPNLFSHSYTLALSAYLGWRTENISEHELLGYAPLNQAHCFAGLNVQLMNSDVPRIAGASLRLPVGATPRRTSRNECITDWRMFDNMVITRVIDNEVKWVSTEGNINMAIRQDLNKVEQESSGGSKSSFCNDAKAESLDTVRIANELLLTKDLSADDKIYQDRSRDDLHRYWLYNTRLLLLILHAGSSSDLHTCYSTGHGGLAVSVLTSHQGKPGSTPGWATPGLLHVGIVPDNTARWRVLSGISHFLAFSVRRCSNITLIGSQDLVVKRRPYLFTHNDPETTGANAVRRFPMRNEIENDIRVTSYKTPLYSEKTRVIREKGLRLAKGLLRLRDWLSMKVEISLSPRRTCNIFIRPLFSVRDGQNRLIAAITRDGRRSIAAVNPDRKLVGSYYCLPTRWRCERNVHICLLQVFMND